MQSFQERQNIGFKVTFKKNSFEITRENGKLYIVCNNEKYNVIKIERGIHTSEYKITIEAIAKIVCLKF